MPEVKPYTIAVPAAKLERLKAKLALVNLPDELDGAGWDMGPPLKDIERLVTYWRDHYDWRKIEADLNNDLPMYRAEVDVEGFGSIGMHFVHQKSAVKDAIPLMFMHGWPGSFLEVRKMLPLLAGADGKTLPAFHVVAPSLPNYGFSDGVTKRGFGFPQIAEACHKVMLALGYNQYVTQGGDLGYAVTRWQSLKYPESCKANHLNMFMPAQPTVTSNPILYAKTQATPLTDFEKRGLARLEWYVSHSSAYARLHNTRPQTLAYSLADSPVGLLAWMYEKFVEYTDNYPWTDEEVLTWISVYLFSTAGPGAQPRIYFDGDIAGAGGPGGWARAGEHIAGSKLGLSRCPGELAHTPKLWAEGMGEVVLDVEHTEGGHFAAWERPELLAGDVRKMFGRDGPCFGIVEGRNGYEAGSGPTRL